MKTTLNLDDELIRETKRRAAETGRTMTSMIELALRDLLRQENKPAGTYQLKWPTSGSTVHEGVDLADRDSLYERMDGRE